MSKRFGKALCKFMLPALLWISPSIIRSQPAQSAIDSAMEREFQTAMAAEDRGDLDQAQAILTRLHIRHPGIFAIDESLGLLFATREKYADALPLLEVAVHEQPSSDAAHANLGAVLYKLHRNQSALNEFMQAVRINPNNFSAQQSLGRLWMERHRPDEAAKALEIALRLQPTDPDLRLDCATALLAADRLDDAQRILSDFTHADQSARAQSLLGDIAEKQGKFQNAAEHLARAAELDPSEENAWRLGNEFLQHWTFTAAIAEFEAASVKFPESTRLRLGLGAAFFGAAQYANAVSVFADLLKNEPGNPKYAELLGIACNAISQTSSPRCRALVSYAQSHPSDAKVATYAAAVLITLNENGQNMALAEQLLKRALAIDPKLPETQFQMGVIMQYRTDWKGSIPYLEHAIKLKPDFAQAHYRLARAYWKTGRKQDGEIQMALQKKYARQEQDDLDRRLRQISRFVVDVHQ